MKKKVLILGSTGSIGEQSIEVLTHLHDQFEIVGLITHSNGKKLSDQINKINPTIACLMDETAKDSLHTHQLKTKIYVGRDAAIQLCAETDYDILISSLVGFAGLEPTLAAIHAGKHIALANKETLIVAGHIITQAVAQHQITLKPIDSEHSAIFQCLVGEPHDQIEKVILTASGGPFLHRPAEMFEHIKVEDALKHPNWVMGRKITIDSASLMNKGLEVIEAKWLFNLRPDQIEVVIHPQSIIHSMVQFTDGSVKAQLGVPDMKVPIQYAITHPGRSFAPYERLNFSKISQLTFFEPDLIRFPCLRLAFESMTVGGSLPCVMNAANEIAVDQFLNHEIGFMQIPLVIEETMKAVKFHEFPTLQDILDLDLESRRKATEFINKLKRVVI